MPRKAAPPASPRPARKTKHDSTHAPHDGLPRELVIITGLSGSGKASALKAFEDLGYYSVDNLPLDLLPAFADLVRQSTEILRAALVVDVREGQRLDQFPELLNKLRKVLPTQVFFLEASDAVLLRRFSETRRPHPLGRTDTVVKAIDAERRLLDPIRNVADETVDTSQHNVHELRDFILSKFERGSEHLSQKSDDLVHQLRLQKRRAAGGGPGLRCALPAQPALRSGVPSAHRETSQSRAIYPAVSANRGISRQDDRPASLSCCRTTSRKGRATSPSPSDAPVDSIARS